MFIFKKYCLYNYCMNFKLKDGFETKIYKWEAKETKFIMQIVHGSAEHAKRYEEFAKWLNKKGVTVWSIDLRGHGEIEKNNGNLGYFGSKGKHKVIEDINEVTLKIKNKYPDVPYTLLGHSMGSFIVRATAFKYSNIDNLIAVGTNHQNKLLSSFNSIFAKCSKIIMPKKHKAKILDKMSYKAFDKKLNKKHEGSWISKNNNNVIKFNKDPLCGFVFTNNGFDVMSSWVNSINSKRFIKKQNKNMRILFLAGSEDPVGNMTKEVSRANKAFIKFGLNSKLKIYKGMRHEILNEENNEIVYKDIFDFINIK